ncbi:DinB family protein [Paenibacillus aceris]|uniref:Damage-inducible protein DinB n=1 Tax=Paenibacillus aceris TaxID=869555 RepID=A0ABS4HXG9_9BACL|nr:DinB family protein [Paenibacillus aceris]MBP1963328.1 putative damage-inducible protein DinB [Paenibacillus aceris]NHW36165.1 DinB family protein [Paenibacillus aceris]
MSRHDIQAYLDTHNQLLQAVEGLTPEQLIWKETSSSWSVTEVLAHLADHSLVISFRIRDILAGTTVRLPAFNQDAWVSGQRANDGDAADILTIFNPLLRYNSLLFHRLSDEDWQKTGINAKGEAVSVTNIIQGFTKHVNTHLQQIERIKRAFSIASEHEVSSS